jgi:CRP-like cAMP-binding protein
MVTTTSINSLLRNVARLVSISAEDENSMKNYFTEKRLLRKQFLLQADETCRHDNYVVSGSLRAFYVDKDGDEHTLQLAIDDYWITDLNSLMNETPSSIYIQALEPSEVLQIESTNLNILLAERPVFERFFRLLHQRAYVAQTNRILNNIALNGHERYQRFADTFPEFVRRIPQKFLASYLGMTPVFLSQFQGSRKLK